MKALKKMNRNLFLGLGGFVRLSYFDTAVADPGLQISGVEGGGHLDPKKRRGRS